jgi:hypothetical protein
MFAFSDVKCVYVFVFLFSDVFSVTLICWGRETKRVFGGGSRLSWGSQGLPLLLFAASAGSFYRA